MPTRTMNEFYVSELQRLYGQEQQFGALMPKMIDATHNPELKTMLKEQWKEIDVQFKRLEEVFADVGRKPIAKKCPRVEGLCRECETVAGLEGDPHVRDVAIIATTQHITHDQIAGYGCVRTWAGLLGKPTETSLLQTTLDEKKRLDGEFSRIATKVNKQAMALTP